MIKTGDRVNIISGNVNDHCIGDEGIVIDIVDGYFVKVEVKGKWSWNYHPKELKKIIVVEN